MSKVIQITLPDLSKKRQSDVLSAMKGQNIECSIEGNKLTFKVADDTPDSFVCMMGVMIGVNMCKVF